MRPSPPAHNRCSHQLVDRFTLQIAGDRVQCEDACKREAQKPKALHGDRSWPAPPPGSVQLGSPHIGPEYWRLKSTLSESPDRGSPASSHFSQRNRQPRWKASPHRLFPPTIRPEPARPAASISSTAFYPLSIANVNLCTCKDSQVFRRKRAGN